MKTSNIEQAEDRAEGPTQGSSPKSLRARAFSASVMSVVGQGTGQVLRVVGNMLLTRLLVPEAFGVMAIVVMVMQAIELMSNVGVGAAIVRHPKGDDQRFLDTSFTIQASRGLILFVASVVVAFPVAYFYENPTLVPLILVTGLTAPMRGFEATKLPRLMRNMDLGRLVLIELASQIAALGATLGFALYYRNVWALVSGHIVAALVRLVLSHVAVPGPGNRFRYDRDFAKDILSFGRWIFVSTMFAFFSMRLDVMLLGRFLPLDVLGVYSVGIMVTAVLTQMSSRITEAVVMPALAKSNTESRGQFQSAFRRSRGTILALGLLAFCAGAATAPAFFFLLYDNRYQDAGWIAQLSMIGLWFSFLHESAGRALLALGLSRPWAMSMIGKTVASLLACLIGFHVAELPGLMIGAAVGAFVGHIVVVLALRREEVTGFAFDVRYTAVGVVLALAVGVAPRFVVAFVPVMNVAFMTLVCASLVLGPFAFLTLKRGLRELRSG